MPLHKPIIVLELQAPGYDLLPVHCQSMIHRGYYMAARGYEFYLRELNVSSLTRERYFPILISDGIIGYKKLHSSVGPHSNLESLLKMICSMRAVKL